MSKYKRPLDALLPATFCTSEMRLAFEGIAASQGRSLGDVQREAFAFFLSRNVSQTDNEESLTDGVRVSLGAPQPIPE